MAGRDIFISSISAGSSRWDIVGFGCCGSKCTFCFVCEVLIGTEQTLGCACSWLVDSEEKACEKTLEVQWSSTSLAKWWSALSLISCTGRAYLCSENGCLGSFWTKRRALWSLWVRISQGSTLEYAMQLSITSLPRSVREPQILAFRLRFIYLIIPRNSCYGLNMEYPHRIKCWSPAGSTVLEILGNSSEGGLDWWSSYWDHIFGGCHALPLPESLCLLSVMVSWLALLHGPCSDYWSPVGTTPVLYAPLLFRNGKLNPVSMYFANI